MWTGLSNANVMSLLPLDLGGNAINARYLYWPARRATGAGAGTSGFTAALYRARIFRPTPPDPPRVESGVNVIIPDIELVLLPWTQVYGFAAGAGTQIVAGGAFSRNQKLTPESHWYIGFCQDAAAASSEYWCAQGGIQTGATGYYSIQGPALSAFDTFPTTVRPYRVLNLYLPLFTLLSHKGLYHFGRTSI